ARTGPARSGAGGTSIAAARALSSRSSSAIGLPQVAAEPFERTREPRLDGAAAAAERRGGLLLRELEQVAGGEHEPVALGQAVQRREEPVAPLGGEKRRLGGRGRVPRGRARACPQRELLPPARCPPAVPRLIGHD